MIEAEIKNKRMDDSNSILIPCPFKHFKVFTNSQLQPFSLVEWLAASLLPIGCKIDTWEEFMTGDLQYCINTPRENGVKALPLQVVEIFTKQTGPQSWKGMDLKVQHHLPLLGHCSEVLAQ